MGSSTVELSLDPIVLQNQTFTTKKTHHMSCKLFQLVFFLFFQNKMFISLSTARLRFVQTPTPSGQHWNRFFQTIFSFQKNFLLTKKTGVPDFCSKPKFFLPFVSFSKKEKTEDEKYHTRTTPSDFLLIFCISKYGGEMAFLLVPGNSQFVIKAHSKFIYNTSGCNCIKTKRSRH